MLTVIVILCILIWLPIIFHQISHRGFLILLIWLLIAPVATNVVKGIDNPFNPFFSTPEFEKSTSLGIRVKYYKTDPHRIILKDFREPTRLFFSAFLFVFLISAIMKKKHVIPLDRTETWMGVFSIILVGSVLLQSNRLPYSMRITSDSFIIPFVAYYVVRRIVISEDRFRQLTQTLGCLGLYLVVICLIERVTYIDFSYRISGPFESPYELYITLTAAFYSVLVVFNEKRTVRSSVLYLTPVIILLTFFRGNWVGYLSSVWVFLFLRHRLVNRSEKLRSMGLVLTLIPLILLAVQSFVPTEMIESRVTSRSTIDWRLVRWKVAWEEGLENPIFGIGLNNTRDVLAEKGMNYTAVHNSFLTLFAENGLVGLIVFLAIVMSIMRMGLGLYLRGADSRDRLRGIGTIAVLVAYLIPGLFASTLHSPGVANVYVYVFLGAIAGLYSRQGSVAKDDPKGAISISEKSPTPLLQGLR